MNDYIEERVLKTAAYIIEQGATVRDAAKVFCVSKSTVHKDVAERLARINPTMAAQAKKVLAYNKAERHIRGGMATQRKYKHPQM
nr:sporulation transcriptional regulator SpoIIID [Maliibacterium massiliense]